MSKVKTFSEYSLNESEFLNEAEDINLQQYKSVTNEAKLVGAEWDLWVDIDSAILGLKSKFKGKVKPGKIKEFIQDYISDMNESAQLNEAASWGVDVEEPFSDKAEKNAMNKFKFVQDAITIVGASGYISDEAIETEIQFSNGDGVLYNANSTTNSYDPEVTVRDNQTNVEISVSDIDRYIGSTGTVVGDMGLIYRDYKLGKLKG